ncbi:LysM peptidoglycan-binding domain-containing protein [Streptococcus devriesei]|uniref:LysM peptidoglycan-binding domain-containing protein n=1 Tax=Streptococcus devriesei TaxID=231233 RepID=UPI0004087797|nr:LysM domain-containing protein [Streptococcus devriesei]
MKKKQLFSSAMMLGALVLPMLVQAKVAANDFYADQTNAQRADITNWVASTPDQISSNISSQNINLNHLNGERYIIQWGDTLWGISQATGISIQKLAYDNNIANVDLIYAGDVLILNRDGKVPASYTYKGSGRYCAHTSININFYSDNDTVIIVNNTSYYEDNHIEHNYPAIDDQDDSSSSSDKMTKESTDRSSNEDDTDQSSTDTKKKTKPKAKEKTLETEVYQDTVQDEMNKLMMEESSEKISFISHDEEKSADAQVEDLEKESLYQQAQIIEVNSTAQTQKAAKEAAKAIYEQLKTDGHLQDLTDAQAVQLDVSAESKTELSFNLSLYNKPEETEPSDTSSDDESDVPNADTDRSSGTADSNSNDNSDAADTPYNNDTDDYTTAAEPYEEEDTTEAVTEAADESYDNLE